MKSKDASSNEMENFKSIKKARIEHLKQMPQLYRPLYLRALGLQNSQLVKAQCQACIGYEAVKDGVLDCRGFSCPLYFQRPYKYDDTLKVKNLVKNFEDPRCTDSA